MSHHPTPEQSALDAWLAAFASALEREDRQALASLFTEDADWRDIVAFTWDFSTAVGPEAIADRLLETNAETRASQVLPDLTRTPTSRVRRAGEEVVEGFHTFETSVGHGTGIVRLREEPDGRMLAKTLLTTLQELEGFEERRGARRPHGTAYSRTFGGQNWKDLREAERAYADRDPEVLVVGGGQAGLTIAARLRTIGVDALVIDAHERVGDVWRKRYHSLTLHNEAWVASLPYLEFPDTWPTYIPKDKLADWFEFYAEAMELNTWTSTRLVSGRYDESADQWTVELDREGTTVTMQPRHVVMATGSVSGIPSMPKLPGLDEFAGEVMHSSRYSSGAEFRGRRALVIGTGTSGHDVAQDLHALGSEVSIVQRSSTTVVSLEPSGISVYALFSQGLPLDDADLIAAGNSFPTLIKANQLLAQQMLKDDAELLERLHAVGFRTDIGEDHTGFHLKYNRRGGGYYINVGCSDLIADGEVGLIQHDQIERFTADGVRLRDGSVLPLDLVVMATGYGNQQEDVRRYFGDEVADAVGPIWGVDDGGEMRNMWRRTAQPGLWFHAGSLAACRANSKYLAVQIKAELEKIAPARRTA
ncbi:flavin-containing monooxygenase [Aeromicrobium sp. HA]|uniref:flavin-containing monooxygenase n=1 Tax=Aeromicrobium sp. HA TaxID=3009077 RepID=UPI0022AE7E8A|nr:NAD(P)/FAD-dependent oxidoreductase [Aeromicrobium sp. HA]